MKQSLQLKVSQHLTLTPQLQQAIRLLQLSTLELNAEIDQALQENPLLERVESDQQTYTSSLDLPTPASTTSETPGASESFEEPAEFGSRDEEGWGIEFSSSTGPRDPNDDDLDSGETQTASMSLQEHLNTQLMMSPLSDRERVLTALLIESLNDDGYLMQSLDDLLELFPQEETDHETLRAELASALCHVQNFDPPGVGARSAKECLTLQLNNLRPSPEGQLALSIVANHLDHLAAHDFLRIKKSLRCSDDELRLAQELICSLNPHPGSQFSALDIRYVIPDVTVKKVRKEWVVTLNNEAMPRLRINKLYADILRGTGSSAGLAAQLQEAKWLIKNVQQRFDTILRVSQAIVDRQRAFFEHGAVAMRPLVLREIAEAVNLHESTISRVTTQKYLASPRGVYELKYFFGSHVATDSGGAASSTAIRALIKQLVSSEDGKKPLSDARIADILGEQGIVVARRTVAKYRELLHIPPVNLRKIL
ncbi:MAG: RNA polymerase factor sigma-54 [Rugosibacter sp.]|jgi:RNA polymerase sigma-54 factor|nr:RNA polymerase factor sigma-54 [Rugosibacter sp.]MDO9273719.1 RNA polymerase factor sigma-54 [Rugosibacter sp.]